MEKLIKETSNAQFLLNELGNLSSHLVNNDRSVPDCFEKPLEIMKSALEFNMSVLYKVENVVENDLILNILKLNDPKKGRIDLTEGTKIVIDLNNPNKFYNEAQSFKTRSISSINHPGIGCDIMGYIYLPDSMGGSYLFGGDYFGHDSSVQDYEISVCEVMCNLISSILMKSHFEELSINDTLTGLLNKRGIKAELAKAFTRFQRKKDSVTSIVLGDIDYFKKINDQYGHIQGDSVLIELGKLISSTMRSVFDVAGRYGGEEILLIFEETNSDKAIKIVERLREKIASFQFRKIGEKGLPEKDKFINLTMSFGISCLSGKNIHNHPDEIIDLADKALYESKENGRNRVTIKY